MPESALPPHLRGFNWEGTDNASFLMRCKKKVQVWLAAGPRASGFWKWREIPKVVFLLSSAKDQIPGDLVRWENTDGTSVQPSPRKFLYLGNDFSQNGYYVSRIQPWLRWHISLQWPFFFNFHVIYCQKNVASFPTYQSSFGICKMLTFGFGFKRDGDKVYWLTANFGGNFE